MGVCVACKCITWESWVEYSAERKLEGEPQIGESRPQRHTGRSQTTGQCDTQLNPPATPVTSLAKVTHLPGPWEGRMTGKKRSRER